MTDQLKQHLSRLLSHSYQMGKADGYTQGFKDAIETLKGALETVESGNGITKRIMDSDLKKLWLQLEDILSEFSPEIKVRVTNPLDNTFLKDLIKPDLP